MNLTNTSQVAETENKISSVSNFLKKRNLDPKISTVSANLATKDDIRTDVDFVIANEKRLIKRKQRQKLVSSNNYFSHNGF